MARTALITGSATGIGRAVALKLASQGYNIAINALEFMKEQGEAAVQECRALGAESELFLADVTSFE
ncbi:SDR family NAD(P)-dependent oxidoreductase, partial [Ligaoa zhengdingensis]